ncbi:MAG: TonB-dependent receptor [Caulobacteraceae bacterium]
MTTRRTLICAAALVLAPAFAARAQQTTSVQEVIVTAEHRATDIQKTPVAITAVPAATIDRSFITNVTGLNSIVPSFQSTRTSGFENIVTIRGIGSETPENDLTTVPGVSLFIDGVYVVNTISLEQTLFDLDHIEVLRGPQGALYGQSSIGGAINIVTNQPELHKFSGDVDFSAGNYSLFRERGEVNIPIGDTIAIRLSAQRFDHSGFIDDLAIPGFREDDSHNTALKAAILWQPVSNFSATLTGQWYRANGHGDAQKNINDPEPSAWEIYQDYPSKNELSTQLYHLNLEYDAPWFVVRSVTAYQHMNSALKEDSSRSAISLLSASGTCPPIVGTPTCYDDVAGWNTTLSNWTEEFDVLSKPGGPVDWIVGAFVLNQRSRQFVAEFEGGDTPGPDTAILPDIETNPPGNLAYGNDSLVKRQSYSAFVQATWHILPDLRLTGGARYNVDHYSDFSNNFSEFGACLNDPVNCAYNEKWDHVPTWRGELDWDATPDNMLYASVARGYKPGGVNGNNLAKVVPFTFEAETNTAFEFGSKNFFLDRALRFNAAAFYYLYKNMQYIEYDPYPFASGISNIPSVHIYGLEGEASYTGMDGRLHINGSAALEEGHVAGDYFSIDSTVAVPIESAGFPSPCAFGGAYYNSACWAAVEAAAENLKGHTPPAMPNASGSINASYDFNVGAGTLTPRVELIYRGSEWARVFNEPSLDKVPAYTVTNLNLEYLPRGSRLRIDLTMTNVFNVAGVNSQYTDPYGTGQTSRQYIAPRQYIVTVGYAF